VWTLMQCAIQSIFASTVPAALGSHEIQFASTLLASLGSYELQASNLLTAFHIWTSSLFCMHVTAFIVGTFRADHERIQLCSPHTPFLWPTWADTLHEASMIVVW